MAPCHHPTPPPRFEADVSGIVAPDLDTVERLARLQLAARRAGGRLVLRGTSARLHALLERAGLYEVLGGCSALRVDAWGEAEEREEARRV